MRYTHSALGGSVLSELKIDVQNRNDNVNIIERELPKRDESIFSIPAWSSETASTKVIIVFEPSSTKKLFDVVKWGSKFQMGDVEQAGILLGNYYQDKSSDEAIIWGSVVSIVAADNELVNASYSAVDITASAWKKMYDVIGESCNENLHILGWYHTHIDKINTRFSAQDVATQEKAFTFKYSFGVVLNPNQKKWSVYYGPESIECVGDILLNEELMEKYGELKIKVKNRRGDTTARKINQHASQHQDEPLVQSANQPSHQQINALTPMQQPSQPSFSLISEEIAAARDKTNHRNVSNYEQLNNHQATTGTHSNNQRVRQVEHLDDEESPVTLPQIFKNSEVSATDFDAANYNTTCPRCGFVFNS